MEDTMESIESISRQGETTTYSKAAEARRVAFAPTIATCDAGLDREAEICIKQLGVHYFKKWKSQYSNTVNWLQARLQMYILRSVSLCLSGFRTEWRGAGASNRVDLFLLFY